jgi:hypothetical protein
MDNILNQFELPDSTTWIYLSSLITVAVFFKFSRFWSVRNLDLVGLVALAPGLLLVAQGRGLGQPQAAENAQLVAWGYVWLFSVGLFFVLRLLGDPLMVRRPLLEPNMSVGGLTFTGLALLAFIFGNVLAREPTPADLEGTRTLDAMFGWAEDAAAAGEPESPPRPGLVLINALPRIPSRLWQNMNVGLPREQARQLAWVATARALAIMAQLAVVAGLVLIGYRHFGNVKTGLAVATLYLLLPYTAQFAGHVDHVVPAALLVWAVFCYRSPLAAGALLGLAIGVISFPLYLLPLWAAFYWHRGLARFFVGVGSMLAMLSGVLWLMSRGSGAVFWGHLQAMLGVPSLVSLLDPDAIAQAGGFWTPDKAPYRLTVFIAFAVVCAALALWPARKNLGTLLSCSAAVMVGVQFWHDREGGLYIGWYLALLVLTVFRPNLEDRIALSALSEGWFTRRKAAARTVGQAA